MSTKDALADVRGYARSNRFVLSTHARRRMIERSISRIDVYTALAGAISCVREVRDRWRVKGPDAAGDVLTLIVVLDGGSVVVVTLY